MDIGHACRLSWLVPPILLVLAAGASAQGLPDRPAPSVVDLSRRVRSAQSPKQSAGWVFTNEGRFRQTSRTSGGTAVVAATDGPGASSEAAATPTEDPSGRIWRLRMGEDRTIVVPDAESFPVTLKLIAGTDRAGLGETQWSQTSGPGPVGLIGNRSSEVTVILHAPGAYGLRLTARLGEKTAMSEVEFVVGSTRSGAEVLR
jgi:hypothetical protein